MNFELDSYWPTEAGVNALELMRKLDTRMKLYHINDRGTRLSKTCHDTDLKIGQHGTRLWKHGSCFPDHAGRKSERGCSDLRKPQNWVDNSPLKSMELSAEFMNQYVR